MIQANSAETIPEFTRRERARKSRRDDEQGGQFRGREVPATEQVLGADGKGSRHRQPGPRGPPCARVAARPGRREDRAVSRPGRAA